MKNILCTLVFVLFSLNFISNSKITAVDDDEMDRKAFEKIIINMCLEKDFVAGISVPKQSHYLNQGNSSSIGTSCFRKPRISGKNSSTSTTVIQKPCNAAYNVPVKQLDTTIYSEDRIFTPIIPTNVITLYVGGPLAIGPVVSHCMDMTQIRDALNITQMPRLNASYIAIITASADPQLVQEMATNSLALKQVMNESYFTHKLAVLSFIFRSIPEIIEAILAIQIQFDSLGTIELTILLNNNSKYNACCQHLFLHHAPANSYFYAWKPSL